MFLINTAINLMWETTALCATLPVNFFRFPWKANYEVCQLEGAYCIVGGDSVVHFSGLYLLARALATGEMTVILQTFQHNSFASEPARE